MFKIKCTAFSGTYSHDNEFDFSFSKIVVVLQDLLGPQWEVFTGSVSVAVATA